MYVFQNSRGIHNINNYKQWFVELKTVPKQVQFSTQSKHGKSCYCHIFNYLNIILNTKTLDFTKYYTHWPPKTPLKNLRSGRFSITPFATTLSTYKVRRQSSKMCITNRCGFLIFNLTFMISYELVQVQKKNYYSFTR